MVIRVVLHDHLDAVELLRRNHPCMVVSKSQWGQAQEQVRRLFQVLVNAIRRTNQKHNIPREPRLQGIGELDRVHKLAFFGQDDTFVFVSRKLLFKESGLLSKRLSVVVELRLLEFHHFEWHRGTTQTLHVLFHFVCDKRRTRTTENSENPFHNQTKDERRKTKEAAKPQ